MFCGKEGDIYIYIYIYIYVRIYSQAKYVTLARGNSRSRDDSSWVKLDNFINLMKHYVLGHSNKKYSISSIFYINPLAYYFL